MYEDKLLSTESIKGRINDLNLQLDRLSSQRDMINRDYSFRGKGRVLVGIDKGRKRILSRLAFYNRMLRQRNEILDKNSL